MEMENRIYELTQNQREEKYPAEERYINSGTLFCWKIALFFLCGMVSVLLFSTLKIFAFLKG